MPRKTVRILFKQMVSWRKFLCYLVFKRVYLFILFFFQINSPESVKQRNDVFYLQPERSCVPDSPVWYSTMPLQKDLLMKMLHRIRMVKEVNISLLAS